MNEKMTAIIAELDLDLEEKIKASGHAILAVFPTENDNQLGFAYTIGLVDKQLPELFMVGLSPKTSQGLLNDVVEKIEKENLVLTDGMLLEGLLVNGLNLKAVERTQVEAGMMRFALARAAERRQIVELTFFQIEWPDTEGKFPGDEGFNEKYSQPLPV